MPVPSSSYGCLKYLNKNKMKEKNLINKELSIKDL